MIKKVSKIKKINAREILDSRGFPTVEVELETDFGLFSASVPSGTSSGKYEASEIRDGGLRYQGKGVVKAVNNVNKIIAPKLKGKNVFEQEKIDEILIKLDGTKNKSNLGVNAILGVSIAVCKAGAATANTVLWRWISNIAKTRPYLPTPCVLAIEGGLHGTGGLDTQEIMILPEAYSFSEKLRKGTEIYHTLREVLKKKYKDFPTNVGLEGAFTPPSQDTLEALDDLMRAVKKAKQGRVKIILDIAASTFFENGKYFFDGEVFSGEELLGFYQKLLKKYPIVGLEDPFSEDDWKNFQEISKEEGEKISIIGDDLLVTSLPRVKKAVLKNACNGLILKPNQVGTISEVIETAKYALGFGWKIFVKHRSGETTDSFLADLAVGLGGGYIMAGAPCRGERVVKYNRLLRIEEEIKNNL